MKKEINKLEPIENRYVAYLGYGVDDCLKLGECWGIDKKTALEDAKFRYKYRCLNLNQIFVE